MTPEIMPRKVSIFFFTNTSDESVPIHLTSEKFVADAPDKWVVSARSQLAAGPFEPLIYGLPITFRFPDSVLMQSVDV
jgi:hypothetical protein